MRLFAALEIPAGVRDNLAALVQELRALTQEARDNRPRWARAENLHVTLKFIGEIEQAKLEGIRGALAAVRSERLVDLAFRGLGFFPNERHPRVFWAGIEASENLKTLAADIDRSLEAFGVARERRAFAPHLTLARFEPPGLHEKLRPAIQREIAREFGSLHTHAFHLVESRLKSSGAEYTRIATFPFATEA